MATTLEQAVYPLLLTSSVLGLGIYSTGKVCLRIFYNLIVWCAFGILYNYIVTILKTEIWFHSMCNTIQVRIDIFATVTYFSTPLCYYKRFRRFMKRLGGIDNTLKELGTPMIYRKLRTCSRWVLIGWIACSYIANALDMVWWFYVIENRWGMIIPYIVNHYHHVNMFMDFLFMTFLWYIGTRFEKINEYMRCLIIKKEHGWTRTVLTHRNIMCANYYKHVLWTSMHLHLELCQIARELNSMFGSQLTVEMIIYLIYLTRLCNFIFIHIYTKNRYIFSLLDWVSLQFWACIYMARLFCVNHFCENVSAKANEMERIIHQLTDHFRYADVRDELYQFTLQIIQHPLKFTGLGLFDFGNGFLRKFFLTITTLLIIIVQMSSEYTMQTDT